LTRKIVEAQGGRVGVQSAQGRGSVFYAVLPGRPNARNLNRPPEFAAAPAAKMVPPYSGIDRTMKA
jgi:hypothetical protein